MAHDGSTRDRKRAPSRSSRGLRWLGLVADVFDVPLTYVDGTSGNVSDFHGTGTRGVGISHLAADAAATVDRIAHAASVGASSA